MLGAVGLDVGRERIPYVTGWARTARWIGEYAQTIDAIAHRLQDAIGVGAPMGDAATAGLGHGAPDEASRERDE